MKSPYKVCVCSRSSRSEVNSFYLSIFVLQKVCTEFLAGSLMWSFFCGSVLMKCTWMKHLSVECLYFKESVFFPTKKNMRFVKWTLECCLTLTFKTLTGIQMIQSFLPVALLIYNKLFPVCQFGLTEVIHQWVTSTTNINTSSHSSSYKHICRPIKLAFYSRVPKHVKKYYWKKNDWSSLVPCVLQPGGW